MPNVWIPYEVESDVKRAARVFYIDRGMAKAWNGQRQPDELKLLTGWAWSSRTSTAQRQGFKCRSVCLRDAWYSLVNGEDLPLYRVKRTPKRQIADADAEQAVL